MNHNVKVALGYTVLSSLSAGIWGYTVLSGYLFTLTDQSNSKVGLAEGIQGMAQGIAAFPAGMMADRLGRDKVLRVSALIGLISIFGMLVTLGFGSKLHGEYLMMTFSLVTYGVFAGASTAPLEALFADSIATEDRPRMFQYKFTLRTFASSAGPLTAIILFTIVGDTWTLPELRTVFGCGVVVLVPATVLLMLFRDEQALGEESDPYSVQTPQLQQGPRTGQVHPVDDYHRLEDASGLHIGQSEQDTIGEQELEENLIDSHRGSENQPKRRTSQSARYWVPRLIAVSDLLFGLASGMTIKFFPLFFKDETKLNPRGVNLVMLLASICSGVFAIFARKLAATMGRIQVCVLVSSIGISLLYTMWIMGLEEHENESHPLWENTWVIVPIYVIRTGLMNCDGALTKSVLMDYVDKNRRGCWNAFASVTQLGWSGSAMVGGVLADKYGYGATFLATAAAQTLALLVLGSVRFFVST